MSTFQSPTTQLWKEMRTLQSLSPPMTHQSKLDQTATPQSQSLTMMVNITCLHLQYGSHTSDIFIFQRVPIIFKSAFVHIYYPPSAIIPSTSVSCNLGASIKASCVYPATNTISLDVTIGFDPSTYSVNEASMTVQVCTRILDGSLQKDVMATLSTSDGTATGLLLAYTTKIIQ